MFCNGNQVRFQEKGVNKFDAGVFVAGETFQVIVNDAGAIEFYVDGDLKYTSLTSPSFPLYADTSFHNHLAELANARWVHKVVKGANDLAAMEFEDAEGVESSAGQVTRTMAGSGWNVGATSKRAITKIGDEVRGVSADCDQTDKSMMIGLNSGSTNSVDEVVDFGIVCDNGVIRISEHGVVRDGDFGDYFVGETFQVVVLDSGVVTYYKDGAAFATSDEAPAFPLYATARFNTAGASFSRVSWIQTVHEGANDLDLIEWVGLSQGMTTDGKQGYLKRTARREQLGKRRVQRARHHESRRRDSRHFRRLHAHRQQALAVWLVEHALGPQPNDHRLRRVLQRQSGPIPREGREQVRCRRLRRG